MYVGDTNFCKGGSINANAASPFVWFCSSLDGAQQIAFDLSKPKTDIHLVDNKSENGHELDRHIKNKNQKVEEDDVQSFNDIDLWLWPG